jgi:hypothetical protein
MRSVAVMVAGVGVEVTVAFMRRTARSAKIMPVTMARNVRFTPGHRERGYQCKKQQYFFYNSDGIQKRMQDTSFACGHIGRPKTELLKRFLGGYNFASLTRSLPRVMKRKSGQRRGRPATGHIKVQFNIRPEINRMIDLGAAKQEITRSRYIENLFETALWPRATLEPIGVA